MDFTGENNSLTIIFNSIPNKISALHGRVLAGNRFHAIRKTIHVVVEIVFAAK